MSRRVAPCCERPICRRVVVWQAVRHPVHLPEGFEACAAGGAPRFRARARLLEAVSQVLPRKSCKPVMDTLFNIARNSRRSIANAKVISVTVQRRPCDNSRQHRPPVDQWVKFHGEWEPANSPSG